MIRRQMPPSRAWRSYLAPRGARSCYRDTVDYLLWKAIAVLRLSPRQDWGLARILYKRARGLLPTLAWKHRARANLRLALAQVSARERGLEPAGGAREMIEDLQERLRDWP